MLTWPRVGPWLAATISLLATQGVSQSIPAPNIDFQQLGQVAVAGKYDALSIYQHQGQREGFSSNGSASVLAQLPDGFYEILASTDASIETMCPLVLKNNTLVGVMVGGNFTSIAGIATRSAAMIDPYTFRITPQNGIQGTISALLCDKDTETVYVGGSFEAAGQKNAITWVASGAWATLPFAGFDAPVTSIVRAANGSIVFGGSFSGLGNSTSNATRTGQENQAINLVNANIISGGNTTSGKSITCPPSTTGANSPWLLRDNTAGYWQADLRYGFEPSKVRIWNTHQDGRGTKTWRFTALPNRGIMNFTYTDPATGRLAACDATCPLSNNASIEYQDFYFVNKVGMNSIRIDVSDWYGAGGGLAGIQLYQSDIFTYAISAFDEPACAGSSTPSNATATGAWRTTPSGLSTADYLTVVTGPTTVGSTQIVFEPDVKQSGNYSVVVYTPGCLQDSSCSARAIVNVTGSLTAGSATTFSSLVYQTNYNDKYDIVYTGRIDAATTAFRPRVTLRASGLQTDQLIVASRIRLEPGSTTGGLNGLFEYNPNNAVINTDFSLSVINSAANKLKPNAQVLALATHDDAIFSAGQFTDDTFENIMYFAGGQALAMPNGGLNAAVTSLYAGDQYLFCGGNFTGTKQQGPVGLNNVAAYQYSSKQWVALGAGLDGRVENVSPIPMNISSSRTETVVAFSGNFRNILANGSMRSIPANGFAIWVPSRNAWLASLSNVTMESYAGRLSAYTILPNNTWIGAGTLTSLGQNVADIASLQSGSSGQSRIQGLPITIQSTSTSTSTSSRKRDLLDQQNVTGVAAGLYYTPNNGARNLTVLGGRFTANSSSGAVIQNLLFLNYSNNNAVSGLPEGVDNNSTFLSLATQNDVLIAGGKVTGRVGNARIGGLVMYDLLASAYRTIQPAALSGNDVIVKAIAPQPDTSAIYVGGSFDATSQGLSCRSVCMYDTSSNQWNSVGGQLDGFVTALYWSSNTQLIAAGNLTVSGNATRLAVYDPKQLSWSVRTSTDIPGPVSVFLSATSDGSKVWVAGIANNGSTYLMKIDGNTPRPVVGLFERGTNISGLTMVPLTSSHGRSDYLDQDRALLVTGHLNLTGFGPASAALFNGSAMNPFILASTSDGLSGSVNQIFTSNGATYESTSSSHSRGITVLVALCAALGTIFLIILCGILLNYIQRRREGYSAVPSIPYADKHSNLNRVPPESLFGSLGQRPGAAPTV